MGHIMLYGKEHTFLEKDTGLLFRNSSFHQTAALHTHTFYEMFAVAKGTALHMVNDAIQMIEEGDLVFIRPSDTHTYEFFCSDDFRIINIGFSKRIFYQIRAFLDNNGNLDEMERAELPPCVHLDADALSDVTEHFLQIGTYMEQRNPVFTRFFAQNYLSGVLIRYFFRYTDSEKGADKTPEWFTHLLEEMQKVENLQAGFPRMQELAPCSVNHLCRAFKKTMGVTPTQYINGKRLDYAVYLLAQTSDDILSISDQCGFNSLSHFYHLFKEKYRMSPAKFRKTGAQ